MSWRNDFFKHLSKTNFILIQKEPIFIQEKFSDSQQILYILYKESHWYFFSHHFMWLFNEPVKSRWFSFLKVQVSNPYIFLSLDCKKIMWLHSFQRWTSYKRHSGSSACAFFICSHCWIDGLALPVSLTEKVCGLFFFSSLIGHLKQVRSQSFHLPFLLCLQ